MNRKIPTKKALLIILVVVLFAVFLMVYVSGFIEQMNKPLTIMPA